MNSIEKFLLKLYLKSRSELLKILEKISKGNLESLGAERLSHKEELYKIRKGKIRVVFKKYKGEYLIVNIDFMSLVYRRV